jgi:siderophore synthetase component
MFIFNLILYFQITHFVRTISRKHAYNATSVTYYIKTEKKTTPFTYPPNRKSKVIRNKWISAEATMNG